MLQFDQAFQSVEVALSNKIIGILMHTLKRKHNLELNLFYLPNPLVAFSIMNSKAFHFCRIRSLQQMSADQDKLRIVLDYWISQGAEQEFFDSAKKFSSIESSSVNVVYFNSLSETEEIISYFPTKTTFVLFKKKNIDSSSETIWEFMHPLWAVSEIIDHAELQVGNDHYFILTCEKR